MKAVILAAGIGKRLRPLSEKLPKGLIDIGGKTLLEYSLNALTENDIKEVIIVVGFLKEAIREKLGDDYRGLKINYVVNEKYDETGSMYSLSKANDAIGDNDIILLESDLLYDPKAVELVVNARFKDCILVAELSNSGDEVYVCVDKNKKIIDLGKDVSAESKKNAVGELAGISKFSEPFLNKLFQKAEEYYKQDKLNYHYEECVFQTSALGNSVYGLVCKNMAWVEIDNEGDLARARKHVYPKIEKIVNAIDKAFWLRIWKKKGALKTNDLKELDGFENTTIDPKKVSREIKRILDIKKSDRVLEVGCGAGMIACYLDCRYVGMDYSRLLAKRHIELCKHTVIVAEANNIPFKDESFDKSFAFSVFHYFSSKAYAGEVLKEMKRVCKKMILIGDLPMRSHRREHLLFGKDDFKGEVSEGFYNKDRFNISIKCDET